MPDPRIEVMWFEYWDVDEENIPAFLKAYRRVVVDTLMHVRGYAGTTLSRRTGPSLGTPERPRRVIWPHISNYTLGRRTDFQIDYDAMLQHEYTFVDVQLFTDRTILEDIDPEFKKAYNKVHPNWREDYPEAGDEWDVIAEELFSLTNNHWDVYLEPVLLNRNDAVVGPITEA